MKKGLSKLIKKVGMYSLGVILSTGLVFNSMTFGDSKAFLEEVESDKDKQFTEKIKKEYYEGMKYFWNNTNLFQKFGTFGRHLYLKFNNEEGYYDTENPQKASYIN